MNLVRGYGRGTCGCRLVTNSNDIHLVVLCTDYCKRTSTAVQRYARYADSPSRSITVGIPMYYYYIPLDRSLAFGYFEVETCSMRRLAM